MGVRGTPEFFVPLTETIGSVISVNFSRLSWVEKIGTSITGTPIFLDILYLPYPSPKS